MNTAIVLAGGKGSRMKSDIPKQYMELSGKPVIYYSLKAFQENVHVDRIVLVTAQEYVQKAKLAVSEAGLTKVFDVVVGGTERYDSVYAGLACVGADEGGSDDVIFIHDGARPCVTGRIIDDCYEEAVRSGACVAAVPVKDTIKVIDSDGFAEATPDRKTLWQMQTPQTFLRDIVKSAYDRLYECGDFAGVTDDAMVVERYTDCRVRVVKSDYCNIKITTPEDMELAELFLNKSDF